MNQRNKGAAAEREVAKLLNGQWLTAGGPTVTARRGRPVRGAPCPPEGGAHLPAGAPYVPREQAWTSGICAVSAWSASARDDGGRPRHS